MQEIIASVDHIKFDLEIAVEQQLGAQPLPFPGMDKSGAAVCEFFLKAACGKGGMCPFRHISGEKTVVCKHWLRGLCKKGDQCEFLHEYDMTKMPECYFYSKFGKALQIGKVCHQAPATIHTHTPSISSPGEAPLRTKTERC